MPASGISQGIQPIIGNNYGAGNYRRVIAALCQAAVFSVSITCFIWMMVLVFPKQILGAFGGTEEMLRIGISGLRINFCITPVLGFVMLAATFFQSINRPAPSIIITVLRQIVFWCHLSIYCRFFLKSMAFSLHSLSVICLQRFFLYCLF